MRAALAAVCGLPLLVATAPALAAFPRDPPNDPLYDASPLPNATNEQWDLAEPSAGFDRGISMPGAWRLTTGAGVAIADIDVGVDLGHPDLAGQWYVNPGESALGRRSNGRDDDGNGYVDDWRGYDFYARDSDPTAEPSTNLSHGTHVAGVLGAATDNGVGIAGIAPGAAILPLRTADNILHQSDRLAEAIVYAADRGAGVASMSLGTDSNSRSLFRAAAYARRKGLLLVAAIGNEFHFHHNYPAALDEAIAVGGVTPDTASLAAPSGNLALIGTNFKVHAAYSDYGPHIDVAAPTQVPAPAFGGGYVRNWSGTSTTTPHVAGVAALVQARGKQLGLNLRPEEVRQVIRQTADDLAGGDYRAGWDQLSGWGRVNATRAVERVRAGAIPPETNLTAPTWYTPASRPFAVRGVVKPRSPASWTLELGRGEEPVEWRRLAGGSGSTVSTRIDPRSLQRGGWTLRLQSRDANGNVGEDRDYFFALGDPTLKRAFPKRLGTSGESSPQIANLVGGRRPEIVLAGSDGVVRVLSGRTGRGVRGWPRRMRSHGPRRLRRRIGRGRKGFLGTVAIGNIAGGRRREVVAAGLDGRVYAWTARGRRVRGFPVRIDLRRPASRGRLDAAIYATPALADLDGNGKLDIVVGAADQKVYAWNGRGRRLPGWPVLAREGGDVTKILSSPAVGDLDGDRRPDVVEATAEVYGGAPNTNGRVYAWNARGRRLAGWPVAPGALAADAVPLAGEGVPVSPSLADVDGDRRDEVAISAFTGQPELYRGDGSRVGGAGPLAHFSTAGKGSSSRASATAAIALGGNGAFGRLESGGPLRFFAGLVDARLAVAQQSPARKIGFEHLLGGWDARSGAQLPGFPAPTEGWTILTGPVVADVDGDGRAEVVAGSSGYLLHAWREDGSEPPGWPKQTGGWLLAAPAVGDVDRDGLLEVVAVTREGWLFVWNTPAPRSSRRDWPAFRHDLRNSGRWPGPLQPASAAGGSTAGGRRTANGSVTSSSRERKR